MRNVLHRAWGLGPVLAATTGLAGALAPAAPAAAQQSAVTVVSNQPGFLGVRVVTQQVLPGTPGAVDGHRMVVTDLYQGGPAQSSGLRKGDLIVRVNGAEARDGLFHSLVGRLQPGDPLELTVIRDGRPIDVAIEAGNRPDAVAELPKILQVRLDSVEVAFKERLAAVRLQGTEHAELLEVVPQVHLTRVRGDSLHAVVMLSGPEGSLRRLESEVTVGPGGSVGYSYVIPTPDSAVAILRRAGDRTRALLPPAPATRSTVEPRWRPLTPYRVGANRVAGAEMKELDRALGSYFGVERGLLVIEVAEGTPGREAGLQAGDVIRRAAGQPVSSIAEMRTILGRMPGQVTLSILRKGRPLELRIPG